MKTYIGPIKIGGGHNVTKKTEDSFNSEKANPFGVYKGEDKSFTSFKN